MSTETKMFLGVIGGTLLLIFGAAFALGRNGKVQDVSSSQVVAPELLVKDTSWGVGSPSAPLVVVEFSDFQCPACKAAQPIVKSVLSKYDSKIKFYYRHFPLAQHPLAIDAAVAAEAAGKQGAEKFWAYHDKLFDNQPNFEKDKLKEYARDLGLDLDRFSKDLESDEIRQKVLNDQADGNKAGVNSTPTFFVGGTKLANFGDLEKEISSKLQ